MTQHAAGRVLRREDAQLLARWKRSDGIFALREAHSVERLLDYVYFFLHRSAASDVAGRARGPRGPALARTASSRASKALIVDDDMRNIFALATVLDEQGMEIVSANNGREAIKMVESDADIDIVLMDIMMPEMDGITTIAGDPQAAERGKTCRSSR